MCTVLCQKVYLTKDYFKLAIKKVTSTEHPESEYYVTGK